MPTGNRLSRSGSRLSNQWRHLDARRQGLLGRSGARQLVRAVDLLAPKERQFGQRASTVRLGPEPRFIREARFHARLGNNKIYGFPRRSVCDDRGVDQGSLGYALRMSKLTSTLP